MSANKHGHVATVTHMHHLYMQMSANKQPFNGEKRGLNGPTPLLTHETNKKYVLAK